MKILLVEDQQEAARVLKVHLEAERYSVDVENDGDRGSYRARTNEYDLILLDSVLPGKNGSQICKELREYKMSVPIMILSVRSEIDQKVDLLNCGADDYLTKPFSLNELSARMKALMRRPNQIEDEHLAIEGLMLDRKTFSAVRAGQTIYLTPKEFSLLEYFMKNPGRVLTRGMILEHVWDGDADPFSKSIETHVMNLRKKIRSDGGGPIIQTIPGRGYKLNGATHI